MSEDGDKTSLSKGPLDKDGTFIISRSDFSDGREKGDYATRYSPGAWLQIGLEGFYLFTMRLIPLFQVCLDVVARCELPICADCRVG